MNEIYERNTTVSKENTNVNFIFYGEWIDYFNEMSDEEIAQTMRAIFDTVEGKTVENLKGITAVTYKVIKNQIERDVQKYRQKCAKNKENIKKRWEKDTNAIPTEYERNTTVSQNDTNVIPNGDFGMVKKSNKENDNENKKEKKSVKEKTDKPSDTHRFIAPTVEEVAAYCEERQNGVGAERFVDFYASKGWYVGKNKMRDWKAAVRTWERDVVKPHEKPNRDFQERQYTRAEMDKLFDNLDDVEI